MDINGWTNVVSIQRVRPVTTVSAVRISADVNMLMAVIRSLASVSVNPAGLDRRAVKVSIPAYILHCSTHKHHSVQCSLYTISPKHHHHNFSAFLKVF